MGLQPSSKGGARAYVGREADGRGFTAYLSDRDELKIVEQGSSWQTGWSEDGVFSAGVDPVPGLPQWPPSDQQRTMIDEAVSRALGDAPLTPDKLGVVEPEIRAD